MPTYLKTGAPKQKDINSIDIQQVYGHYIVTINGKFYCSADSMTEALQEVEAIA